MEKYKVKPTSRNSADVDDIIIRETDRTRLVFKPKLVNNVNDEEAAIKGCFTYQRKSRKEQWEETDSINLAKLKAGEGVKLSLRSKEVLSLFKELGNLYNFYNKEGIPGDETEILTLKDNLKELNSMTEKQLSSFLNVHDEVGLEALNKILSWALKVGEPKKVLEKLEELDINILEKLNSLLGLSRLKEILEIWDKERNNSNENYWQDILGKYAFVLSQIFSFPFL